MNCEFPKIISDLRKSKGISQKQAAIDLGISQALLSHYEKGIRECGLDFLIKLSDYYEVTCDELLGISRPESTVPKDVLSSLKKIAKEAEKILNNQSL
ncbi:MAG: helix-turn-helix transcriptional regulator [Clostridia bacterium]|nr:helix-turn-helix transcriptional regulator [Clostridia bacterium]